MDERKFGGRAYFQAAARPAAALIIDNTTNADSGLYRCRVDFHKSPTRNARVQLRVISKCFEEERKDGRYFREQWERTMESGVEWSGEERRGEFTSTRTRNFCFNESCSPFKRFNYSTIKSHSFVIFSYLDGRRKHEQWMEECLYKIKSLLIQERQIKRIPSLHYRDCCFFVYFGWFFFVIVCSSPGEGAHAGRTGRAHTKLHTRSIQRGHVH